MKNQNNAKNTLILLNNTANWLQSEMTDSLSPLDISVQQLRTLAIVAQMPEQQATVNDIKLRMYDPNSNVSRLLNKLMDKRLIKKVRSEKDQRVVYIRLTDAGETLLAQGQLALDKHMASIIKLTDTELNQLSALLGKLNNRD